MPLNVSCKLYIFDLDHKRVPISLTFFTSYGVLGLGIGVASWKSPPLIHC